MVNEDLRFGMKKNRHGFATPPNEIQNNTIDVIAMDKELCEEEIMQMLKIIYLILFMVRFDQLMEDWLD